MSIPNETFCKGMHEHQIDLFAAFDQRLKAGVRIPGMFMEEWHRRCRKTTAAINLKVREACRTPRSKYVYVAPTQVMARNIVWDDPNMLRAYLPDKREMDWKLNEQKMLVTFENKSTIKIGGSDEPDSLRGIDAVGVTFDEWSLIKENTWLEIFRPIVAGPIPPHLDNHKVFRWANFLYTPKGMNHAAQMFDKSCCLDTGGTLPARGKAERMKQNWFASRVDGEFSGIFSQEELARMKEEMPKAYYDQEIRCSRVTVEEMTLITTEMIYLLNEHRRKTFKTVPDNRKIISIDPAWGGDVCKIMGLVGYEERESVSIRDKLRTSEIIMAGKVVAQKIGTKNFIIDCVNDVGIADGLSEDDAGYNVQRFKSSYKATDKKDTQQAILCANRRAEAYLYTSRLISKFEVGEIKNKELIRQLPIASRYTTKGSQGRLIIIPKLKIKEELGCSPDDTDCYVMGCWGTQNVQDEGNEVANQRHASNSMVPSSLIKTW